jgi:hypothetical protein
MIQWVVHRYLKILLYNGTIKIINNKKKVQRLNVINSSKIKLYELRYSPTKVKFTFVKISHIIIIKFIIM